jgi:hypothetical protein
VTAPRWFVADEILAGRVDLGFVHAPVAPSPGAAFAGAAEADAVPTTAEFVETRGRQVVNFGQGGQIAYLRRP